MHNVNLITYPDFVSTGFQVVLINVEPEQQLFIAHRGTRSGTGVQRAVRVGERRH